MIKLFVSALAFLALVIMTGGIYLFVRKGDDKKSDLARLRNLPVKTREYINEIGRYISELFATKNESSTTAA